MYPYFIVQGHKIYAVGIGIVISALVFLLVVRFFTKRYRLQFSKLFYWLPTLLIVSYLLGNWAGLVFDSNIRFPLRSLKTIGAWLSPYGYHFHFVGLMLGAAFARRRFFKKIFMKTESYKRVDTLFFAFAAALIPLGLFLLLGDTFIGKTTNARYGVIPLLNDSAWINYGRVFPLGIMISILGFIAYGIIFIGKKFIHTQKIWGYLGFGIVFLGLAMIFVGEHYPRHGVLQIVGYTFDVKNYVAILVAIYFFFQFLRNPKKR